MSAKFGLIPAATTRETRKAERRWREAAKIQAEAYSALEEAKLRHKEAVAAASQAWSDFKVALIVEKHK